MPCSPAAPLLSAAANADRKTIPSGGGGAVKGAGYKRYAVIFDAGSSGSRVHVYCVDKNLDLLHIGTEMELFLQQKPGLSSFAKDPQKAANSLIPLLEKAESVVPAELREKTPFRVGATAGLRALGAETSENFLQEASNLLKGKSSLKFQPDWVSVIDGTEEGAFQWETWERHTPTLLEWLIWEEGRFKWLMLSLKRMLQRLQKLQMERTHM